MITEETYDKDKEYFVVYAPDSPYEDKPYLISYKIYHGKIFIESVFVTLIDYYDEPYEYIPPEWVFETYDEAYIYIKNRESEKIKILKEELKYLKKHRLKA